MCCLLIDIVCFFFRRHISLSKPASVPELTTNPVKSAREIDFMLCICFAPPKNSDEYFY